MFHHRPLPVYKPPFVSQKDLISELCVCVAFCYNLNRNESTAMKMDTHSPLYTKSDFCWLIQRQQQKKIPWLRWLSARPFLWSVVNKRGTGALEPIRLPADLSLSLSLRYFFLSYSYSFSIENLYLIQPPFSFPFQGIFFLIFEILTTISQVKIRIGY